MSMTLTNLTYLVSQAAKYLILLLMALYTLQSFTALARRGTRAKERIFTRQIAEMYLIHFLAFLTMFLKNGLDTLPIFWGAQAIYLGFMLVLYRNLYPRASRLLINHMCLLMTIGFIMITRLSYDQSVKQFKIACAGSAVALLIPWIVRKLRVLERMSWAYAFVGIGLLALVLAAARMTNGAKLSLSISGISFQPSEFVKIIFVFAVAGLLSRARSYRRVVTATVLAAVHVLILVISTDLGSALIFFVTYLVMLFVATRNPYLVVIGVLAGCAAAIAAYFLFSHVRVRVEIWLDPFADYSGSGYQLCQSLFAIAAGGWFGTGLCQGSPGAIPYVEQDFMFSAIAEELGSLFAICLILVCMSCFMMFVNIAMKLTNRFYRLTALGLGTTYATQCFLTIGGGIKLIPLTGVTLPLVSYGGSSLLSTMAMFSIVQGLYMLRSDEGWKDEERRFEEAFEADRPDPGPGGRSAQRGYGYGGEYRP